MLLVGLTNGEPRQQGTEEQEEEWGYLGQAVFGSVVLNQVIFVPQGAFGKV